MGIFKKSCAHRFLARRGKNHIVGWNMTLEDARQFFERQGKTVLTFFGYSVDYEDEPGMLDIAREVLTQFAPDATLINVGATEGGLGAVYPLAKSLGFTTTGIVSTQALSNPEWISEAVDYVCFIADESWGGKLSSGELSPTSQAMVMCSDVLSGIGGGPISRDEMLAGKAMGKPVVFHPAEISQTYAIRRAKARGLPEPTAFWGEAHEAFEPGK
jgi:hypothetical protein